MPHYQSEQPGDAVQRLIVTTSPRLYRYALVRLGRADLAEDAVGETLVRLVEKGPPLEGNAAHVTGWCVRCMVNICREMSRRSREQASTGEEPEGSESTLRFTDWHDGHTEDSRMLMTAMAHLSDRQKEAVILRILMGLPVAAAAEAMECAEGTVKALTHQAIASMRTTIESRQKDLSR